MLRYQPPRPSPMSPQQATGCSKPAAAPFARGSPSATRYTPIRTLNTEISVADQESLGRPSSAAVSIPVWRTALGRAGFNRAGPVRVPADALEELRNIRVRMFRGRPYRSRFRRPAHPRRLGHSTLERRYIGFPQPAYRPSAESGAPGDHGLDARSDLVVRDGTWVRGWRPHSSKIELGDNRLWDRGVLLSLQIRTATIPWTSQIIQRKRL